MKLAIATSFVLFLSACTASALQSATVIQVETHYSTYYDTIVQDKCRSVKRKNDSDVILGAILGGVIGKELSGKNSGALLGAIVGGSIGAESTDRYCSQVISRIPVHTFDGYTVVYRLYTGDTGSFRTDTNYYLGETIYVDHWR